MYRKSAVPAVILFLLLAGIVAPDGLGLNAPLPQTNEENATSTTPRGEPSFILNIQASLNPAEWKIEGHEKITVFNRTSEPVKQLCFHCRPNDFANDRALEKAVRNGSAQIHSISDPSRLGYIDIREVQSEAEVPFPETAVSFDGTLMQLELPAPLAPGSKVVLSITFIVKLPDRTLGGLGHVGRHVDALGWYPRPSALPDQGEAFGDMDVTLTVPADFKVEATGDLMESNVENAIKRIRYTAAGVRDFCWTADPICDAEQSLYHDVEIVLLQQPYMAEKIERLMETAKYCIDFNRTHLVPYPHKRFVVAATPYGAGRAISGTMFASISQKHPAHLACLADRSVDPELDLLQAWARQTSLGTSCSNLSLGDGLGEGLAQYLYLKMVEDAYKPGDCGPALQGLEKRVALHLINYGFGLYPAAGIGEFDPGGSACCGAFRAYYDLLNLTALAGFRAGPFHGTKEPASVLGYRVNNLDHPGLAIEQAVKLKDAYATNVDPMPATGRKAAGIALGLKSLENHIGWETMQKVLKNYLERRASKGHSMSALLEIVSELAGVPMASLAAALLYDNVQVDFAVVAAECRLENDLNGFVTQTSVADRIRESDASADESGSGRSELLGEMLSFGDGDAEDPVEGGETPVLQWQWEVTVRNWGNAVLPVTVRLNFEGGKSELKQWDGEGGTWTLEGVGPERLLSVEVDPEAKYALDLNRLNNRRSVAFEKEGVLYLAGWFQFWLQNYLNGWAFLN